MPPRPTTLARINLVSSAAEPETPCPARREEPSPLAGPQRTGAAPAEAPVAAWGVLTSLLLAVTSGFLAMLAVGTPLDGSASARPRSVASGGVNDREKAP